MAAQNLPGLGVSERSIFLNIKNSKILYKPSKEEEVFYNYIAGRLTKIAERTQDINGKTIVFYDFLLENSGVRYKLSTIKDSNNSRSIINSLMGVENLAIAEIKIAPYENKNGFTNIAVYANGQKADWFVESKDLPKIEEVKLRNGNVVHDSGELVAYFEKFVKELNSRLDRELDPRTGQPAEPIYAGDDIPEYMDNGRRIDCGSEGGLG